MSPRTCMRGHGARDAAIFHAERRTLSWYDLQRESDALAAGLLALGIRRGNRVGIWAPNRTEWLLAQFATARIGAILVNINPAYQSAELEYALNKVRCRAFVTARGHKSSDHVGTTSICMDCSGGPWRSLRIVQAYMFLGTCPIGGISPIS